MILKWFLKHQWKESMRSTIWQKNVAINIILGFFILLMLLYLLLLGLFIDKILTELFPEKDLVSVFNGFLLYYFGFELLLRFLIQTLPTLNIETYLHLPVKKPAIVHFVAIKSIVAIGNYLSWLVLFPFAFKVIAPANTSGTAWIWIFSIVMLIYANNFLATYIKRQLTSKPAIVGIFASVLVLLAVLDYTNIISVSSFSSAIFGSLLKQPVKMLIPAAILIYTYLLNYYFLKSKLYPEEVTVRKKEKIDSIANIRYLKTLGLTGALISLELRLLWRHKRTRSIIFMAPLFLGYGFFFYPQEIYREGFGFLIFVGIFMTGGMMLNYLNYTFGYESNYFDIVLSKYRDFERYLRVKLIIAILIASVCFVLTIPYVLFSVKILYINIATFLYNIGFLSFVLYYFATFSKKRMDLSKGAAFNYQGMGATHWLSMLPAFLLPVIIYLPFGLTGYPYAGIILIGGLGLLGLLLHKTLLGIIMKQFDKRKYSMAEGFRA